MYLVPYHHWVKGFRGAQVDKEILLQEQTFCPCTFFYFQAQKNEGVDFFCSYCPVCQEFIYNPVCPFVAQPCTIM